LQAVAREGTSPLPAAIWTPPRQLTQDQRGTHPLGK
jgi:hypothetical protein